MVTGSDDITKSSKESINNEPKTGSICGKEEDKWYETITCGHDDKNPLQQGDIIESCPIVVSQKIICSGVGGFGASCHGGLAQSNTLLSETKVYNVIVMSQSCDLAHKKIKQVQVCPIIPLEKFVNENKQYKKEEYFKKLRTGNMVGYHLLNKCKIGEFEKDLIVVDFTNVHDVPLDFLNSETKTSKRLRSPYREHLSQAFARFFMRVGLPSDIPETPPEYMKSKIKFGDKVIRRDDDKKFIYIGHASSIHKKILNNIKSLKEDAEIGLYIDTSVKVELFHDLKTYVKGIIFEDVEHFKKDIDLLY